MCPMLKVDHSKTVVGLQGQGKSLVNIFFVFSYIGSDFLKGENYWCGCYRGVARYLKILFDEEFGRGRKSVAMDQLIAGKTRKEASRMFFETLVC